MSVIFLDVKGASFSRPDPRGVVTSYIYDIRALTIFEKYGLKESQSIAYMNIGAMYLSMDNYRQAEINFMKLNSLVYAMGDSLYIAYAKYQLGNLYLDTQDYAQALQNAEIAFGYFSAHPEEDIWKLSTMILMSGIYLKGYDDDRQAEDYARQALSMAEKLNVPREKSYALGYLSMIYLKRGQWRQAEQTALEALAADDGEPANTLSQYKVLAKAYARLGNVAKTGEYIDKMEELQSTWSNQHYQSAIREMEVKYETEKKEHEIEKQQQVINRQNMQRILLFGGIVLCVIILVLLWYVLRMRTRRNRTLLEMNLTKDKFFNIISHDLRNPVVAQRDAVQLLIQNAYLWDADTLATYYNELLKSADNQVELIYNLLGWAQIQTGRMTYTPTTFNLAHRLRSDISLIQKMAAKKGITLAVGIPEDTDIICDGNMLATIVRNLLSNAVKFTAGGGTVTLSVNPTSEGKYTVAVSDTGIGMSKEQISKLFRLDSTHSRKGTAGEYGSGLGLIVCKELIEKHGSTIYVESEEGKGSKFWFEV